MPHCLTLWLRWLPPVDFALVFNLFGRVAWSIAISPAFCTADCVLGLGLLEMIRRSLWILLRLETAYIKTDTPIFTELGEITQASPLLSLVHCTGGRTAREVGRFRILECWLARRSALQ